MRAISSAALSSSVWLVCKKRAENARPGWDNRVLEEMQERITRRLRDFWDAGIRGPDFVWAATGPALEVYSQHPIVKMVNEPGRMLTVTDFLGHVRRMVADFVVGRVLTRDGGTDVSGLDNVTTYYLLHRHDFGMESAPIGPCILYALSCGLSDADLVNKYDLLARSGSAAAHVEDDEIDAETDEESVGSGDAVEVEALEAGGATVRLKQWRERKNAGLEQPALFGGPLVPLIDQAHRLMHLWKAQDIVKVDEYLDMRGLAHHPLFNQLVQALIEMSPEGSDERVLLENISNHIRERGALPVYPMGLVE